jgi:hypothetical protein
MAKRVKLILEFDLGGGFPDDRQLGTQPEDWEEYFFQSDANLCDMEIIKVIIEEDLKEKE